MITAARRRQIGGGLVLAITVGPAATTLPLDTLRGLSPRPFDGTPNVTRTREIGRSPCLR